jgi:glucokinase
VLLAGDVGGTKTLLGLFRASGARPGMARPTQVVLREYATLDFDSLDDVVKTFLEETGTKTVDAIAVGVAGPVKEQTARLTNVPWIVDVSVVAERCGGCPSLLLNDLEAMGSSVEVLDPDELATIQEGDALPTGNGALIAAGTGLGEALLHNVDGRFVPAASEGGHADFAARTFRELALVEELTRINGRVSNEHVISGQGLVNLFRFTHGTQDLAKACRVVREIDPVELPKHITASALEERCEQCVETLDMFVEAYGAEAGNLALRAVALAGVYLGGGIAPKILPALEHRRFIDAFCSKEPMTDLLRTLPVYVILNSSAGILGAAVRAAKLTEATA